MSESVSVKGKQWSDSGPIKNTIGGYNFDFRVKSSWDNFFLHISKEFSQEDFAPKSKFWPPGFLRRCLNFAANSRSTGISQLRAGETRSKQPRSHCLSTGHLLPYMWASFHPLDPSRYLSSFSSWRPKSKKIQFFTNLRCRKRFFFPACCGLNFDPTDLPNS